MFTHAKSQTDKPSILIIDDNQTNRKVASMVMSKVLGVPLDAIQFATEIDSAVKAVEGKIASTKRSFDFIVMDYEMPAANGDAVTLKVRDIEDKYGVNPSFIFS